MKENETQEAGRCIYVCCNPCAGALPPCVTKPKRLEHKPFVSEEWEVAYCHERAHAETLFPTERCVAMEQYALEWLDVYMDLWSGYNPCPKLSKSDTLESLAERITVLEAKLANEEQINESAK